MMENKLMKTNASKTQLGLCALLAMCWSAPAFQVPGGSTGADGDLNVTANTTLTLPDDGVFNFGSINVDPGVTLTFTRNANNTPVYLLATNDVTIAGTIDVSGSVGVGVSGGSGGPGGGNGGNGFSLGLLPGAGQGPGGGRPGTTGEGPESAGSGSYGNQGSSSSTNRGAVYGTSLSVPLVGGSGGAGNSGGWPGGGGGGGILICSDTTLGLTGTIRANGGGGFGGNNGGSGGAIRLLAPVITGTGTVQASGGGTAGYGSAPGGGRIRIDAYDFSGATFNSGGMASQGAFVVARLVPEPRLDIVKVGDTNIVLGSGPVDIIFPTDSPISQTVSVRAEHFNAVVPIEIVLKPVNGDTVTYTNSVDNSVQNPATNNIPVDLPGNTVVHVEVFKR